MNFNELKIGDLLFYRYDSQVNRYMYIDKITNDEVFYHEINILHRKNKFTYGYDRNDSTLWDDRDFIFSRLEKCEEDINILIEYIFEYEYREER